jgi:hypothetical protein
MRKSLKWKSSRKCDIFSKVSRYIIKCTQAENTRPLSLQCQLRIPWWQRWWILPYSFPYSFLSFCLLCTKYWCGYKGYKDRNAVLPSWNLKAKGGALSIGTSVPGVMCNVELGLGTDFRDRVLVSESYFFTY